MIEFVFDADFVFVWEKSLKKVHSQLFSILRGLGQPSSHMCNPKKEKSGVVHQSDAGIIATTKELSNTMLISSKISKDF